MATPSNALTLRLKALEVVSLKRELIISDQEKIIIELFLTVDYVAQEYHITPKALFTDNRMSEPREYFPSGYPHLHCFLGIPQNHPGYPATAEMLVEATALGRRMLQRGSNDYSPLPKP